MPHAPDLSGHALNDRYELHAVIGEGAFGRVYRAWDQRLERKVAVKLIKPWWGEDPEWAQSFEREARLLARISHPGIVQIFDVGQADEGLYYVSELVEGESLAHRLADRLPDPWTAAALTEQICRALAQAHAKNVIHRDVKPANILISEDGRVKVGDFGVARLAEGSSDGASATIVGTPRYMAPEQARGLRSSPATDVYSVGVVLYEMLAGAPPFTERSAVELALRHLRDQPPPLPAGTPAAVDEIVARALAKDPAKRYAGGAEMADALARARTGAARERSSRRTRSRRKALVGAVGSGPSSLSGPARPAGPAGRAVTAGRAGPAGPTGPAVPAGRAGPAAADSPARRPPRPPRGSDDHELPTRRAPKFNPRRNLNPAARRRSIGALTFAFVVLGAMIAAAIVLSPSARVRTPSLLGLTRSRALASANRLALQTSFSPRFSSAPKGTVVAQDPRVRTRVREGSTVHVWLSSQPRGPSSRGEA
jgi:eukaryotic-like serine/threonine-protein kinase